MWPVKIWGHWLNLTGQKYRPFFKGFQGIRSLLNRLLNYLTSFQSHWLKQSYIKDQVFVQSYTCQANGNQNACFICQNPGYSLMKIENNSKFENQDSSFSVIIHHTKILFRLTCHYNVLYCIVLYCIVLYCIVLYCIVLYCIIFLLAGLGIYTGEYKAQYRTFICPTEARAFRGRRALDTQAS